MNIFSTIRERRLFQIVASYLAAGWIALEVVSQFVERGILPDVVYELVLIAYFCGIGATLLVGWYHGEKGEQRAPPSEIAMLGIVAAAFVGLSALSLIDYRNERMALEAAQREASLDLRRIGVLYLDDYTQEPEYRYVADAFTEALIDELSRVAGLEIASRNAAAHVRESDLSRDSIARILGVGTLVDGSVEQRGGSLRISIRLFDGHTGNEFRSAAVEARPEELLGAQERVVEDVAALLRQWLGEEIRIRAGGQRIRNAEAWALYHRAERARKEAEELLHRRGTREAIAALDRADSLLTQAALLAPEWPQPLVLRATTAYRRSRWAHERYELHRWVDEGLRHAEEALRLAPNSSRALEARGTLRYWKYLQSPELAPDERRALLADARRDLEAAVRIEPLLASAHSTLSHLLYREDMSSALLAARRAYEADAYLEAADGVLLRLVLGNYDLENFDQMQRWCDEGARRFPENFRFTDCRLLLMTTREVEPDVDRAWRLRARLDSLSPDSRGEYDQVRGLALVGGVIARAAARAADARTLEDSARAVLDRARGRMTPETAELRELLAHMYALLGDNQTAIDLLRQHAAANPGISYEHHWRWRELRGLPEFQPLLAGH